LLAACCCAATAAPSNQVDIGIEQAAFVVRKPTGAAFISRLQEIVMKRILAQPARRILIAAGLIVGLAAFGSAEPTTQSQAAPAATVAATMPMATMAMATEMPMAMATEMPMAMATEMPMAMATMAPAASGATADVAIQTFQFTEASIEVKVGTTVTWTNNDDIDHSVTSGTPPEGDKLFDSDFFLKGKTFSQTFTTAGEFPYFCRKHNSMVGMVKVTQ
jgi:plastocyanin